MIKEEIVDAEAKYALGWIEKEVAGERMLYHTGSVENYTAAMILLPGKDLGISMMFNGADALAGNHLIDQLEAGILAIELEQKPSGVDGRAFYAKHISVDVAMIVLLLGAWVPVFLMGIWKKKRRDNLWSPVGIGIDALVHLVLPTLLLIIMWQAMPIRWMRRFYLAIYYVSIAVIASLYFGAVIKVIAMVIFALREPKDDGDDMEGLESGEEGQPEKKAESGKKNEDAEQPEEKTEKGQLEKKAESGETEEDAGESEEEAEKEQSGETEEDAGGAEEKAGKEQSGEKDESGKKAEDAGKPEEETEKEQSDKKESGKKDEEPEKSEEKA